MYYKVLHIVDHWLPDTMNWLDALLDSTLKSCRHYIYSEYLVSDPNPDYFYIRSVPKVNYPVSNVEKIKQRWRRYQMSEHLSNWLASNEVHVIHVHFGHMAVRYKHWLIQSKKPIVISLYGFDYEHLIFKHPSVLESYRDLAKSGARFIVEGNYSSQLLVGYGIPAHQISIVHLLFFRNAEIHFNLWNHPIRLLQVATYTEKKNQLELLEALQDRHAGRFSLSFYGEFYNQAYVHEIQKVARSKHKHSISINGKLNFEDYLKALRYTHFSMQWSKRTKTNDTEGGCPVFIKDSLGLGRPVIGSRHCDIPDILVHHFNAYLTEEQDLKALAEILDEIMSIDSFTYLKLQRNALQSVHENKSAHLSGRELIEVYSKMINGL